MNKNTPGPWLANGATDNEAPDRRYHEIVSSPPGKFIPETICTTTDRNAGISAEEDVANARLISAALDMADALEEALRFIVRNGGRTEKAEAALRKAGRFG